MSGNGWIKLHRKIMDHWVSQEPELLAVWVRLLCEANHSDVKKLFNGSVVTIKRGQLIFGLDAFSVKSGVSVSKLRRYIKLLETDSMIDRQKTSKYSIITVTCFDDYQSIDRQTTGDQQAIDRQSTGNRQHYKNVKNVENDKNTDIPPNGGCQDSPDMRVKTPNCPHMDIIDLYHEILPSCTQVSYKHWAGSSRAKMLSVRWREDSDRQNLDWWCRFFRYISTSDFLMGRVQARDDNPPWMADIGWIIKPSNMIKILEGNYDNKHR
jgi:hypothetical protein